MLPVLGLLIGLLIGLFVNVDIPQAFSAYVAVAILVIIDSVIGAAVSDLKNQFKARLFIVGLLGSAAIALSLTALGEQLNLPIYFAAIFAFGNRIFRNVSEICRLLSDRYDQRKTASKNLKLDGKNKGEE